MEETTMSIMAKVPKIELHLHLEGSVRKDTVRELSARPGSPGGEQVADALSRLDSLDRYEGLPQFVTIMRTVSDTCFCKADDYGRVMYEVLEDLAAQNVLYTEISFDPTRGLRINTPFEDMVSAVNTARLAAEKKFGIKAGIIIGLGREKGTAVVTEFVKKAVNAQENGVVGIDLHGNEEAGAPEEFTEAYEIAGNSGLGLRAHAGEGMGPKSVWGAIGSLCVSRIAHGVRAIEDPELLQYLRAYPVTLDICPTSNYRLSLYTDIKQHPIYKLYKKGIRVTVSTDDPLYFNTTITREYALLHDELGFSYKDLERITLYAADCAFLREADRTDLWINVEKRFAEVMPDQ